MKPYDDQDNFVVYEHLRSNPQSTYTSIAKHFGWVMSDGKPYHMLAKRIIDRLLKNGNIKREFQAISRGRFGKVCHYKLICAPIAANAPVKPAEAPARDFSQPPGIEIKGRRICDQHEALLMIRHIANIATGLPESKLIVPLKSVQVNTQQGVQVSEQNAVSH